MLPSLLRSIRPTQWVKNFVVFAGLVFSQRFVYVDDVLHSLGAFAVFCALASAVYLFNDIRDRENDRTHPVKRERPIASGALPVGTASTAAVILAVVGLVGAWRLGTLFLAAAGVYLVLNLAYSAFLKRVAIVDVMIIALGFVLRAAAGAAAIDVVISPWLIVCTTLLALFLGLGKRRGELLALKEDAADHRAALARYSPYLLDQFIAVTTASTVVAYALYTLSAETQAKFGTDQLIWTLPFVLFGVFRYLYLIHGEGKGGNPTAAFLTDPPLLIDVLLWLAAVLVIISRT
ncbi:MAG TPA: decaprenyl-phosphate phosphoribosyltransferase [Acidobacteriota bacterium]|nr:decaprenyl-phosphate phosphoribosyltransferase [Acidobacteriota bacterium]